MSEAISPGHIRRILDVVLELAEPVSGGAVRTHVIGLRKALASVDAKRGASSKRLDDCGVCDLVPTASGYVRGKQVSCPVHGTPEAPDA